MIQWFTGIYEGGYFKTQTYVPWLYIPCICKYMGIEPAGGAPYMYEIQLVIIRGFPDPLAYSDGSEWCRMMC